jgi:hypothetical protein
MRQRFFQVRSQQKGISRGEDPAHFEEESFACFAIEIADRAPEKQDKQAIVFRAASRRSQEIGVRMALGAEPGDVLRLVVRQGMTMVLTGVAIGCAGAFAAGHLISSLLFGVSPADPLTYSASATVLAAVALAACYIPARRAMRVDPMIALRYE